jgi:uncharacterized repeat protein (TIGR01451 family)
MRPRRFVLVVVGSLGLLFVLMAAVSAAPQKDAVQPAAVANGPEPIEFTKAVKPDGAWAGYVLTYTLTLDNKGGEPVTGLSLVDAIPSGTTFRALQGSSPAEYDEKLDAVTWAGAVEGQQTLEITFTVVITTELDNLPDQIRNEASLAHNGSPLTPRVATTLITKTKTVMLPLIASPLATPTLNPIVPPGSGASYAVSWNAVDHADSYVLQGATDGGFHTVVTETHTADTSIDFKSEDIKEYFYHVKARSSTLGDSGWSEPQSVKVYWEKEINSPYVSANGPLISGQKHYGLPNDDRDFFYFDTGSSGTITLGLTDHTGSGVQLQLFSYSVSSGLVRVAYDVTAPYSINYSGPSGRYYAFIYATGNYNSNAPYTLSVSFP